ncbi:alpha-ketoglutarate-dependent dioxygenase AlkB [Oratosquilla oratoria]|uniref:alpha-ketoglutarate-dependent dioxygenase AlkB n=1 Tax=Oratosquilla oratoria TaxID=337810 RepID=UPI003F7677D8
MDNFKESFKYYKRRKPPPNFDEVIDIRNNLKNVCDASAIKCLITDEEEKSLNTLGLRASKDWQVFRLETHPDLLIIPNPFTSSGQRRWIFRCLLDFPRTPNRTNLDVHGLLDPEQSWWQQAISEDGKKKDLMKKLRWVTLGYHHNWDTKHYSKELKGTMPDDLKLLCHVTGKILGYPDFNAQAAIVNYYHADSTLAPHTDHSELYMKAPLFSLSFGQSCIFLIGEEEKSVKPVALYLHSGDVLVMTGRARLAYHAVPRIIQAPACYWTRELNMQEEQSDRVEDSGSREHQDNGGHKRKEDEEKGIPEEEIKRRESDNKNSWFRNTDSKQTDILGNNETKRLRTEDITSSCAGTVNFSMCKEELVTESMLEELLRYVEHSRINVNVRQVLPPGQHAWPENYD